LTPQQKEELGDVEIVSLKEIYPDLYRRIHNDYLYNARIDELAKEVISRLNNRDPIYLQFFDAVLLPTGEDKSYTSLIFAIGRLIGQLSEYSTYPKFIFSQTARIDGQYRHKKFITL